MRFSATRVLLCASVLAIVPTVAQAAAPHSGPVSSNAEDWTPQLVSTTAVPSPRVDAIAADPDFPTAYAGGLFDRVAEPGRTPVDVSNLVAFNRTTGAIPGNFTPPRLSGPVRAVHNAPDGGVYVAGDFKDVDGVASWDALVKLTPTGAVDGRFNAPHAGIVYDLDLVNGHLVVASNHKGNQLMSIDPDTGDKTAYIDVPLAGEACNTGGSVCSWGMTSVYDIAIGKGKLAAVGNFATVDGQPQSRFFMLNLSSTGSDLSSWYYDSFGTPCATDHERRVANLQGVDFSPDGQFLSVAATGQIPESTSEVWHADDDGAQLDSTVCDAFGRFDVTLPDNNGAEWINYTGGDSVWRVQDTGPVTYATGHFQWVDNPDGFASKPAICTQTDASGTCIAGWGDRDKTLAAARRFSIAAVGSSSGTALDWKPAARSKIGGKALVATSQGLWVGSNATKFGTETHRGLALAPMR